jgi:hypothetical protein
LIVEPWSFEVGVLVLSFLDNCLPPQPDSTSSFDYVGGAQSASAQSQNGGKSHPLQSLRQLLLAYRADLLPNYLSQRVIDSVLPARSGFLKVIKNIPINSQRDKLLGIRDGRTLRREFRRLCGRCLERRFSRIP